MKNERCPRCNSMEAIFLCPGCKHTWGQQKINRRIIMEFEMDLELKLSVYVIRYLPGRPAPECRNPSNPNFSDDGDREEMEYNVYFLLAGKKFIVPDKMIFYLRNDIENKIREEMKYE